MALRHRTRLRTMSLAILMSLPYCLARSIYPRGLGDCDDTIESDDDDGSICRTLHRGRSSVGNLLLVDPSGTADKEVPLHFNHVESVSRWWPDNSDDIEDTNIPAFATTHIPANFTLPSFTLYDETNPKCDATKPNSILRRCRTHQVVSHDVNLLSAKIITGL